MRLQLRLGSITACAAVYAGLSTAAASGETVVGDRGEFLAAVDVAHTEDFEGFFSDSAGPWAAVNFGPSTSAFFHPLELNATNGGDVSLFGSAYHDGEGVLAVIDGAEATALITLGGAYSAVGLDLLGANFTGQPAVYEIRFFSGGQPVTGTITAAVGGFVGVITDQPADAFTLVATDGAGLPAREAFDGIVMGEPSPACNPADVAAPFGLLDLADVTVFINAFASGAPPADIAPPFGLYDLADLGAFTAAFLVGCP